MCVHIYIYIYRERERDIYIHVCVYIYIHTYTHIHTYIHSVAPDPPASGLPSGQSPAPPGVCVFLIDKYRFVIWLDYIMFVFSFSCLHSIMYVIVYYLCFC